MSRADEPAFPALTEFEEFYDELGRYVKKFLPSGGVTIREHFAAMALQGIMANSIPGSHHVPSETVKQAVERADALLAELEKPRD